MKILIIEDDIIFAKHLQEKLNYHCDIVVDFSNISSYYNSNYDLVLLDEGLPNLQGSSLITDYVKSGTKVIMITSNTNNNLEYQALYLGAEDFISKPISFEVLSLKIQKLFKPKDTLVYKNLSLSAANLTINQTTKLTKNEFIILNYLIKNQGKIISKKEVLGILWDNDQYVEMTALNMALMRLRKKLDIYLIEIITIKNKGIILK